VKLNSLNIASERLFPFGSVMVGREFVGDTVDNYRYWFNGKEKTDEIYGDGNGVDFGARIYDGRLGRWMSVDPKTNKYPWVSSFVLNLNSPFMFVDITGEEPIVVNGVLVGYRVEAGQGPSQIAADLNNPESQRKYGYVLACKVTFLDIVNSNQDRFTNVKNKLNIDDPEYRKLNINVGDILELGIVVKKDGEKRKEIKSINKRIYNQISENIKKMNQIQKEDSGPVMTEEQIKEQQKSISDGYDGEPTRTGEGFAQIFVRSFANKINAEHNKKEANKNSRIGNLKKANENLKKQLIKI